VSSARKKSNGYWQWPDHFPDLADVSDPAWAKVCESAYEVRVSPGTVLFREGDAATQFLMCIEGAVRVSKSSRSGREVMLYRVVSGDSCVLMTAVILSGMRFPATAVVEVETRAVSIPAPMFRLGIDESPGFRSFMLAEYSATLCQLIGKIDDVVFGRVDARLARILLERSPRGGVINVSHKDLALELGTAREVVSRQLKMLEADGCVELGRRQIVVNDVEMLEAIAEVFT
jgi:CRP/FNR family transcriptional regulator, anaerobic regulatory protein